MRRAALFTAAWLLPVSLSFADATPSLQQQYLAVYLKINDAEQLEKNGDYVKADQAFRECFDSLRKIQETDPTWETALVGHRLNDCYAKISQLQSKEQANGPDGKPAQLPPLPDFPHPVGNLTVSSNKPVYPWKANISATIFWIGDKSAQSGAKASAWDEHWSQENYGADSPNDRNGYAAGGHASGQSPFYVALPFNDLAFPDKALQWLPPAWHQGVKDGKPVSACKDRWIEIKNANGDTCYAQWEDVGPERSDDARYVFGDEPPALNTPGICLSPAVRDYLGLGRNPSGFVSWRFVDQQDVRPGAWLKLDEQAVLYSALHQQQASDH